MIIMKFEGVCFQKELLLSTPVPFLNVCDTISVKHKTFRHNCVICDGSPNFDILPISNAYFYTLHCVLYMRVCESGCVHPLIFSN